MFGLLGLACAPIAIMFAKGVSYSLSRFCHTADKEDIWLKFSYDLQIEEKHANFITRKE